MEKAHIKTILPGWIDIQYNAFIDKLKKITYFYNAFV